MRLYFDGLYNRAYDLTVARLSPYRRLQAHCLDKLELNGDKSILCVGLGTGNEVLGILARNGTGNHRLTGVDISMSGLGRAYRKAQGRGKEIATLRMDAHRLAFGEGRAGAGRGDMAWRPGKAPGGEIHPGHGGMPGRSGCGSAVYAGKSLGQAKTGLLLAL